MRGVVVAFWCCVVFFINTRFVWIPMPQLFVWALLGGTFTLVYNNKEHGFNEILWFLFLYGIIFITFSASFGLRYIFDLKRFFLP